MIPLRPIYAKLVSVAIAAVAIFFIYGSLKMPIGTVLFPAAGMVPLLLGCGTLVLAIAAIVAPDSTTVEGAPGSEGEYAETEDQADDGRKVPRQLLIMIVLGLVILAFEPAGFVLSMFCGTFILLFFIERKPLLLSLIVSLALSGGLYLLLSKLLYVDLPSGWLGL
jgi:putative tricarboxylic transport membrane protein